MQKKFASEILFDAIPSLSNPVQRINLLAICGLIEVINRSGCSTIDLFCRNLWNELRVLTRAEVQICLSHFPGSGFTNRGRIIALLQKKKVAMN